MLEYIVKCMIRCEIKRILKPPRRAVELKKGGIVFIL
nr:MAG TPA: hypothetical protein [Caudoviricetes sp.]